ncbi:MAG: LegC family aminotransferase [Lentisphaeraceae bacterium]|nr:LegC family aminotransferase [Lentisphaeraceae bacterium]
MNQQIIDFIKSIYKTDEFIPLHEPTFTGSEKKYLNEAIDSTFVSSVGKFVDRFEKEFADFVGSKYAIAVVNGTAALHVSLLLAGVTPDDEVLTQPLTFVATCNAISYCGSQPVFIDVDEETMGLCPIALDTFLKKETKLSNGNCVNKRTGKIIRACVPMHTFGHPCRVDEISKVCSKYGIALVEDAAESLGSYRNDIHTGNFGKLAAFSFNGNKVMTSGGGGMIVTDNQELALKAKHLTTTAKLPHKWNFEHDEVAFNYRMPNLNAALACAQLEALPEKLKKKRILSESYKEFFKNLDYVKFKSEPRNGKSNYWLNAIQFKNYDSQQGFLKEANSSQIMSRPCWKLMNELSMYSKCQRGSELTCSQKLSRSTVNIPSTPV